MLSSARVFARRMLWRERKPEPGIEDLNSLIPEEVSALRTEAYLPVIVPWFFRSLPVDGDVCEFGCFRGTMSIKFAHAVRTLKLNKTIYAFDTFEGFQVADPMGGVLGIGAYSDNENAYDVLSAWSSRIPLVPVKGDARETAKTLTRPLSFVWLDLDFDILMAPVLDVVWPLLGPDTIIGIDDVGRPETPSVLPWVERIVAEGRLVEVARYPGHFIRFFKTGR